MKRTKKIQFAKWKIVVSLVLLCLLSVALVFADKIESLIGYEEALASNQATLENINKSSYRVSYIDVGQGNSSFVELPDGKNMLIDGGDSEYGETVAEFLDNRGVSTLDYLVATHADSDHIGGLNYILDNFEVKQIFRPFQISYDDENNQPNDVEDLAEAYDYMVAYYGSANKICKITTKVYEKFIEKIYSETYMLGGVAQTSKVTVFYDGLIVSSDNYEIEFFAPLKRDENFDLSLQSDRTFGFATMGFGATSSASNDNSAIFTISCFDDVFLFVGDSRYTESDLDDMGYSEFEFLNSLSQIERLELSEVDVLLLGHHGSKYSTSEELLNLVSPRFVIVSAGKNNKYKHPHDEVLQRLVGLSSLENDYLLRTDENGDIVFANVDGRLMYCIETQGNNSKLKISFELLCIAVTFTLIGFIFSIRVKQPRKRRG